MSNTFYSADFHFCHDNIIRFCKRPFKGTRDMEAILVNNWNYTVKKQDKIYIVGDFSMRRKAYFEWYQGLVKKLNGRKILILGNHDYLSPFDYINIGFESVHTSLLFEDKKLFIAHDPALANCMPLDYKMICGHVHNAFKYISYPYRILNVGIDVWNFFPASQEEVDRYFQVINIKENNNGKVAKS